MNRHKYKRQDRQTENNLIMKQYNLFSQFGSKYIHRGIYKDIDGQTDKLTEKHANRLCQKHLISVLNTKNLDICNWM